MKHCSKDIARILSKVVTAILKLFKKKTGKEIVTSQCQCVWN